MSLEKVKRFFTASGRKTDDAVSASVGAFAFHTAKHQSNYKIAVCTSVLFKTVFPDSEVALNFQAGGQRQKLSVTW
jgi:hypothetical protein